MAITFEVLEAGGGRATIRYTDGRYSVDTSVVLGPMRAETFAAEYIAAGQVARQFRKQEVRRAAQATERGEVPDTALDYSTTDEAHTASLQGVFDSIPDGLRGAGALLDTLSNAEVARLLDITVEKATAFRTVVSAAISLEATP